MKPIRLLFLLLGGLALFLAVLCLVPAARADGYCRSAYRATYVAPAYKSYAYTPTYTAPSYDYAPTYLKTVTAYTSPDYYSSVSDYYRDKLLVDAVAGKTAEVLKSQLEMNNLKLEVEGLRRQLLVPPGAAPPTPVSPPPPGEANAATPTMPRASGAALPVPEGLQAIVQASCIRCHGATASKTGGGLDFQNLSALPRETRLAMKAAVDDGSMPRGGKPLDDAGAALFHQYATGRSGAAIAPK